MIPHGDLTAVASITKFVDKYITITPTRFKTNRNNFHVLGWL